LQQNNSTPRWIAIIVAIFLSITGALFAWSQSQIADNREKIILLRENMADMKADIKWIRNYLSGELIWEK